MNKKNSQSKADVWKKIFDWETNGPQRPSGPVQATAVHNCSHKLKHVNLHQKSLSI